jgi:hypothetical protein
VTVAAWSSATVTVTMHLSKRTVAALPAADQGSDTVVTLRGQVVATPRTDDQPISIAFMMVPHARSNIEVTGAWTKLARNGKRFGAISVRNAGAHAGVADVYSWLLGDSHDASLAADGRALGVQYVPDADPDGHPGEPLVVLAFNEFDRFSAPTSDYFHVSVDSDLNGRADHEIYVIDEGVLESADGVPSGVMSTYVLDEDFNGFVYGAVAPVDGSTVLGFAFPSDLWISPTSGPAALQAEVRSYVTGTSDPLDGYATIMPFDPQASSGQVVPLDPGARATIAVHERHARADEAPVKGWMIVSLDDHAGPPQADLVPR